MTTPRHARASVAPRRRTVLLLMALALVSQLLLGPYAQALPCIGGMPDCGECPHTQTAAPAHGPTSAAPATDCTLHQAGVCSGLHVTACAAAIMLVAPFSDTTLQAREPSVPPLDGPPFELLRPPQR